MTEAQLQELFAQMTLEEKIGQLVQLPGLFFGTDDINTGPCQEMGLTQDDLDRCGSVLNVLGADKVRALQDRYLARSRLKIPLLFMADVIYGYKNVYPIPLALGATWDPDRIREAYRIVAREATADGCMVTFSPPVDLIRDARWGRCLESPGEDAWLNSQYAKAMVEGFQGDLSTKESMASCMKHFAAYGAVEGGREYNTVDMSERRLRQDYLPAYKAAVDAGCRMVMTSFNTLDGVPATANRHLMKDILRDEWGFDGVIITDYSAIKELIAHGVAENDRQASALAMDATVDIDMVTSCYAHQLAPLVRDGHLNEPCIDAACLRVLRLKNQLGLFEDPYRGADASRAANLFGAPEHSRSTQKTAQQSMVLLKNEKNVLPLKRSGQKIALIGPYADSQNIIGMWAVHADKSRAVTLRTAMAQRLAPDDLRFTPGCRILEDWGALTDVGEWSVPPDDLIDDETAERWEREALTLAAASDVVVLAMGEHMLQSGESGSRTDITLPAPQVELLKKLHTLGKPIVLVLFNGRPLVLTNVEPYCDAILEAWFPGTAGGPAIAGLLFGDAAPSGRLTASFPYSVGQVPIYYNHYNTGRPVVAQVKDRFVSRYLDCPNEPLYPFGYGLGYHTAEYSHLTLSSDTMKSGETLTAGITVKNTGNVAGTEVVQLYLRDMVGSVARPVKELKGFRRVVLQPGESKVVQFTVDEEMLKFYTRDMEYKAEPGEFTLYIGKNSADCLSLPFRYCE